MTIPLQRREAIIREAEKYVRRFSSPKLRQIPQSYYLIRDLLALLETPQEQPEPK